VFVQLVKRVVDCAENVTSCQSVIIKICMTQLLHFADQINVGFLKWLQEQTVSIITIVISKDNQAKLMAGVIEYFLLQRKFTAFKCNFSS
jgi:hypothetical protein